MMNQDKFKMKSLVELLKNGDLEIFELTETKKTAVIDFLKNEIKMKSLELKEKKNLILFNKIKNKDNIEDILNRVSDSDKSNFLKFLSEKN